MAKANQLNQFQDALIQTEFQNIYNILNKVEFGEAGQRAVNVDAYIVETTSAGAGVEFSVTHDLQRVPRGWIIFNKDQAGDLYAGATSNTETELYLVSTTAGTTYKIIII